MQDRQAARGEHPLTLVRVATVLGQVEKIVQQIDARCAEAEAHEGEYGMQQHCAVRQAMRGEQWDEDKRVLEPMMRAQRVEVDAEMRRFDVEDAFDIEMARSP